MLTVKIKSSAKNILLLILSKDVKTWLFMAVKEVAKTGDIKKSRSGYGCKNIYITSQIRVENN